MGYTIPDGEDLRASLTPEERAAIHHRYNNPLDNTSQRELAREFGVSRRLIQFIGDPAKHRANLERRRAILKERGASYYNSNQAEYMRRHRARLAALNTPEERKQFLVKENKRRHELEAIKKKKAQHNNDE